MAKKKLKNDALAKLRQYSAEMDPAEFLSTEWRQVVRALEQSYVETDDIPLASTIATSGFYGVDATTYSSSGNLTFTTYEIVDSIGTVNSSYIFRPTVAGKFWVEVNSRWIDDGSYTAGNFSSALNIKNEAGTTLNSASFYYEFGVAVNRFTSVGPCCVIADLTPSNGVYFSCTISRAYLSGLSFKIIRIGD